MLVQMIMQAMSDGGKRIDMHPEGSRIIPHK